MEWLIGVVRVFGKTRARVLKADRGVDLLPLSELWRRGTPSAKPEARMRLHVNLRQLRPTCAEPELHHMGIALPSATPNHHQVFEVEVNGQRIVVPALLLMREIFSPAKHFLPEVFLPQALDSVTWLAPTEAGFRMIVDASWFCTEIFWRNHRDCTPVLAWLRSCRTAENMVSSIHRHSLDGAVSLDLPKATADVKIAGVACGERLFATELRLMQLIADEAPDLAIEGFSPVVRFATRNPNEQRSEGNFHTGSAIPSHPDGSYEISDSEWETLRPLVSPRDARATDHDRRLVIDGLLRKLGTGVPWRSMACSAGTWRNAAFAYHSLKKVGRFEAILDELRRLRSMSR